MRLEADLSQEFKYLRNQTMQAIAAQPGMYLRMMKAESEGLVEINIELQNEEGFTRRLYDYIMSENVSDIAEAWNKERRDVIDIAMAKFRVMFQKNVKDELRTACEDAVAFECRRAYSKVAFLPLPPPPGIIANGLTRNSTKHPTNQRP